MTPKARTAAWIFGVVGALTVGGVIMGLTQGDEPDLHVDPLVPDSAEGRRHVATTMTIRGPKFVHTEGDIDQGLVLDWSECNRRLLEALVHDLDIGPYLTEYG